jgi:hypothetical protein
MHCNKSCSLNDMTLWCSQRKTVSLFLLQRILIWVSNSVLPASFFSFSFSSLSSSWWRLSDFLPAAVSCKWWRKWYNKVRASNMTNDDKVQCWYTLWQVPVHSRWRILVSPPPLRRWNLTLTLLYQSLFISSTIPQPLLSLISKFIH